ncbi:mitogen-activated protein kinase kinase kinase yoda, partial [Phtheirospermum japonicum]
LSNVQNTRSIPRGLNGIHGLGYVHCDLKPDNILLVPSAGITEFRAKIGDFGLAKREIKQYNKKLKIMESNSWRVTPIYISPETIIDYVQATPSDVWAVGCIMLEMLTRKPIGVEKELPKIPNDISREAMDFLKRCFVRNSMFRFTCDMLLNHSFLQGLGDDVEELEDFESYMTRISDDECSS